MDKFLGHDVGYWLELQKKAETLGVVDLIQEVADLRGKLSFYDSRIKQMAELSAKVI